PRARRVGGRSLPPALSPDPPIRAGGAPVWARQAAPRPDSDPCGASTRPVRSGSRRQRTGLGPPAATAPRPDGPAERPANTRLGGSGLSRVLLREQREHHLVPPDAARPHRRQPLPERRLPDIPETLRDGKARRVRGVDVDLDPDHAAVFEG